MNDNELNYQNQPATAKPETRTRKFWRVVFGSMLGFFFSMILVSILYMVMLISMIAAFSSMDKDSADVKDNSILKINLTQGVAERAVETPFDKFNDYSQIGLDDVLASIKNAATDPKIKGIYINSATVSASPATVKEIHDALLEFKKSGKFIYAYSDVFAQNGYYLASVADKIILNPTGSLDFKGYAMQIMFYKGLIDKLDVDVQVVRHGQFKSAVEPYILDKMSEANREQLTLLTNTLWDVFISDISASRKIPADTLNAIADNLLCALPKDALRLKLVDKIGFPSDMEKLLKDKLNVAEDKDLNFVTIEKYKKSIQNNDSKVTDKIAVVYAVGNINDGKGDNNQGIYSESFIKEFKKAYKDKDVKAIVLRINSPGGSALASENIWQEIEKAKKAGKVVVTSMGDYAASGGYYIACNSNYIIAQPNTITGSIGVFGMIPSFQNTLKNKLGVTIDGVKTNKHSDYGTGFRPMDETELMVMQKSVEDIYSTFTKRVADGRKMTVAQVDSIGQGRVWAGADAIKIGLVDKLGSINDAIDKAAQLAKISKYAIVYYPKQKDWFTMLFSKEDEVDAALRAKLGRFYFTYEGLNQLMNQEGVQARMPMEIYIY